MLLYEVALLHGEAELRACADDIGLTVEICRTIKHLEPVFDIIRMVSKSVGLAMAVAIVPAISE